MLLPRNRIRARERAQRREADGWTNSRQAVDANLRRKNRMRETISRKGVQWAARVHRLMWAPGFMENIYIRGFDLHPRTEEPSVILGFSHKKFHDVFCIVEFMAGRPLDRFHDLSVVAQAGLFNGVYSFRDAIPDGLKKGPFLRPLAAAGRSAGAIIADLFQSFNGYPVYRDGADVPSEEEYNDPRFAGPLVTGMDYAQFKKYAVRQTMNSVASVQKDMEQKNRVFVILPEGRYLHDGAVAELREFVGVTAFRKQRAGLFLAVSYDELCQDRLGRQEAWVNALPPLAPPESKADIPRFLAEGRRLLQENTVTTASHLIACALLRLRKRERFSLAELEDDYHRLCDAAVASPFPFDPNLPEEDYRKDRLARFLRQYRGAWIKLSGGRFARESGRSYMLDAEELAKFAPSERTCCDVEWNRNNVKHLVDWMRAEAGVDVP